MFSNKAKDQTARDYFKSARKVPNKKISGVIPKPDWDRIAQYAAENGCPKSRVVSTLINFAVDKILEEAGPNPFVPNQPDVKEV
tara:strand:+ start:1642 stop:1893 length:252 start_codon:yes stop_codon:yes gene_type:complete